MRLKIVVNPLDKKSINAAIAKLNSYKRSLKRKEETFVRRVMELGYSVASSLFEHAEYDGEKDVLVTMNHMGTRATILAHGTTVGFIEFGTGRQDRNPEWGGSGLEYKPPARGSYGKQQGLHEKGWFYYPVGSSEAKRSFGNPPAEAMLTARNEMVAQVAEIAREVFG